MRPLALAAVLAALVFTPTAAAWTWPADGPVLQPFLFDPAHPYAGGQHRGIDIGGDSGADVRAPATGVVTFAGTVPASGRSLTVETAAGLSVTLTHLGTIDVAKGASVAEGDAVATIGASGEPELATPYVHLGVRVAAEQQGYLDPLSFLPPRARTDTDGAARAGRTARRGRPFSPGCRGACGRRSGSGRDACAFDAGAAPAGAATVPAAATAAAPAPVAVIEAADSVPPASATGSRAAVQRRPGLRRVVRATASHGHAAVPAPAHGRPATVQFPRAIAAGRVATRLSLRAAHVPAAVPAVAACADAGGCRRAQPSDCGRAAAARACTSGYPARHLLLLRPGASRAGTASSSSPCCSSPCCSRRPCRSRRRVRRRTVPIMGRHDLLRDNADLLRELEAAYRPRVHDDRGRHPDAPSPAAGRGDVLPHGRRRARDEGLARRRGAGAARTGVRRPDRRGVARSAAAPECGDELLHPDERCRPQGVRA